jgi:hypothetical protein
MTLLGIWSGGLNLIYPKRGVDTVGSYPEWITPLPDWRRTAK